MKTRVLALALACIMALALLAGCANNESANKPADNNDNQNQQDKVLTVGIIQFVEHPALDAAREAAIKALEEKGFVEGKNIKFDIQNAQNDTTNCKTIAQKFVSDKVDLIYAIATPAAQAVVSATSDIPVVFSAVTDPVKAKLVSSNEAPGKNVTGVSDYVDFKPLMETAEKLYPGFKKIGAVYNAAETNSVATIDELKEWAKTAGKEVVDATIANTSEIQQVVSSVAGKVDILFSPTDNAVASAISTAAQVAINNKKPYFVSEEGMVQNGGFLTVGINYSLIGTEAGNIIADILGGKDPGTIPVKFMDELSVTINKKTAQALGIEIPEDILANAEIIE